VKELIEKIKNTNDCVVLPPSGQPNIEGNLTLPTDVQEFYSLCGGACLFKSADYVINIITPQDFVSANPVILGEHLEDDISSSWYIVAVDGNGEFLTIDLADSRLGQCYDSFNELHPENSRIIAKSFSELLELLIQNQGQYWYWLDENFDSKYPYDDIG